MNGQLPDTVEFAFGDMVYHRTAPDEPGVVIGINYYPGGHQIVVQWSPETCRAHYPFELAKEKGFTGVA